MRAKLLVTTVVGMVLGAAGALLAVALLPGERIAPSLLPPADSQAPAPAHQAEARRRIVTEYAEAVGTIRPRAEAQIASQVTAKVIDVKVNPGDAVTRGQVLVTLDDRRFTSRLDQARQALKSAVAARGQARQTLAAAQAAFAQAQAEFKRVQTYYDSQAATAQDLERAESAFLQARAGVSRAEAAVAAGQAGVLQAEEAVREAQIALDYTRIRAHGDGEVLRRSVEPGDLAVPGKPLLVLHTQGTLRLEAYVREGLIGSLAVGQELSVELASLGRTTPATVEEIVPYADPQSRTFLVKSALPMVEGLFPGMYAKLRIPVGQATVVQIPRAAVRRVGQLETVRVKSSEGWQSRYIRTGGRFGEHIEVLAGLSGDETIGWETD